MVNQYTIFCGLILPSRSWPLEPLSPPMRVRLPWVSPSGRHSPAGGYWPWTEGHEPRTPRTQHTERSRSNTFFLKTRRIENWIQNFRNNASVSFNRSVQYVAPMTYFLLFNKDRVAKKVNLLSKRKVKCITVIS